MKSLIYIGQALSYGAGFFLALFSIGMSHSVRHDKNPTMDFIVAAFLFLIYFLVVLVLHLTIEGLRKSALYFLISISICFELARRLTIASNDSDLGLGFGLLVISIPLFIIIYCTFSFLSDE